jgi:hypothetical protein
MSQVAVASLGRLQNAIKVSSYNDLRNCTCKSECPAGQIVRGHFVRLHFTFTGLYMLLLTSIY